MNEHDALFQTILDNPDDDAPRLVYADWLEEHGDATRAEFIRLQIEAERLPAYEPRRAQREKRALDLLGNHRSAWQLPFAPDVTPPFAQTFRRGFVEHLTLTGAGFGALAGRCGRETPLREVHLLDLTPDDIALFDSPELGRLSGIGLGFNPFAPLMGGGHLGGIRLPRLRRLGVAHTGIVPGQLASISDVLELPALQTLDVSGNRLGLGGANDLANTVAFASLTELRLGVIDAEMDYAHLIRAVGAAVLARSPHLKQLRTLDLSGQMIGDGGVRALAESPNFTDLETLDLAANDIGSIGTTGLELLTESARLPALRDLDLSGNPLGIAGLDVLAGWPGLDRLRRLSLASINNATSEGWRRLARSPYLHRGLWLNLRNSRLDAATVVLLRLRVGFLEV